MSRFEKRDKNCTILILKGNFFPLSEIHSVAQERRQGPWFKVSSEGLLVDFSQFCGIEGVFNYTGYFDTIK